MRNKHLVLALFICASLALAFGCKPKTIQTSSPPKPTSSADGKTPEAAPSGPIEIAPSLSHQGFRYSGLSIADTLTYRVVRHEGDEPKTGTQVAKLIAKNDQEATFEVKRTDALMELGDETDVVRKDGVYLVSFSRGSLAKESLALPADMSIGKTWTTNMDVDISGTEAKFESSSKIERQEKVKVPAGEYNALLIVTESKVTVGGKASKMTSKQWLAEGIGTIRLRNEGVGQDGKRISMTVELEKGP